MRRLTGKGFSTPTIYTSLNRTLAKTKYADLPEPFAYQHGEAGSVDDGKIKVYFAKRKKVLTGATRDNGTLVRIQTLVPYEGFIVNNKLTNDKPANPDTYPGNLSTKLAAATMKLKLKPYQDIVRDKPALDDSVKRHRIKLAEKSEEDEQLQRDLENVFESIEKDRITSGAADKDIDPSKHPSAAAKEKQKRFEQFLSGKGKVVKSKIYTVGKDKDGKCVLKKKPRKRKARVIKLSAIKDMPATEQIEIRDELLRKHERFAKAGKNTEGIDQQLNRIKKVIGVPIKDEEPPKKEIKPVDRLRGGDKSSDGGIYASEIDDLMKKHKCFKGTIAADEIDSLTPTPKMCFVMNLDKRGQSGSHWVSVYIDVHGDQSVEYYDSFGDEPSHSFKQDIKKLMDKLNPKYLLKFKVNQMKHQDVSSDNCGFFAMSFLKDRLAGKSFANASGFKVSGDISKEREKKIEKVKKGFGYV